MRILELEVRNTRGVRELLLKPDGKSLVLWGANGSGKSAVVDAVDFLLTGNIARLTGKGTGGITLGKHGSHIDCDPESAVVKAVVEVPGLSQPVELQRCIAKPGTLRCDSSALPYLSPILALARHGQHVLTRREILRYITAEPSTRAQEIQTLLNIDDVDRVRKALVAGHNKAKIGFDASQKAVRSAQASVLSTAQKDSYQEQEILDDVNTHRAVLGGDPIEDLDCAQLKVGLNKPVAHPAPSVNLTLLRRNIQNLQSPLEPARQKALAESHAKLSEMVSTVKSDADLLRDVRRQQLVMMGLDLLDESGACPLCDTDWPPGELHEYLKERLSKAEIAGGHLKVIDNIAVEIRELAVTLHASLRTAVEQAQSAGAIEEDLAVLGAWDSDLESLSEALDAPIETYPPPGLSDIGVQRLLAPASLGEILDRILLTAESQQPKATPELDAWDILTRLEENLKVLERDLALQRSNHLWMKRAGILLTEFENARDKILGQLYDDVRDRFVDLYRALHGSDEDGFQAKLVPAGAGLDLEVDFHGRGNHPPHALHSEGHQDSMGLCLFLSLADKLTQGVMDIIVLDDVMMSIDRDHRRQLCSVLATSFPHRQFLITTHDRTWARQLRTEGVVTAKNTVEFYDWSLEAGPRVNQDVDMWAGIEQDLLLNDVPAAAGKLRRGSEEFFALACDSLHATVIFNLGHSWTFGEYVNSAIGQYRALLRRAKAAAQSWAQSEVFDRLNELDSIASQVIAKSNVEQWSVNANVHYNAWTDFVGPDFRPVVDGFHDLHDLFLCPKCQGMLHVATVGMKQVAVACNCGSVNWNLTKKGKA